MRNLLVVLGLSFSFISLAEEGVTRKWYKKSTSFGIPYTGEEDPKPNNLSLAVGLGPVGVSEGVVKRPIFGPVWGLDYTKHINPYRHIGVFFSTGNKFIYKSVLFKCGVNW